MSQLNWLVFTFNRVCVYMYARVYHMFCSECFWTTGYSCYMLAQNLITCLFGPTACNKWQSTFSGISTLKIKLFFGGLFDLPGLNDLFNRVCLHRRKLTGHAKGSGWDSFLATHGQRQMQVPEEFVVNAKMFGNWCTSYAPRSMG